jgi:hypothetical protein
MSDVEELKEGFFLEFESALIRWTNHWERLAEAKTAYRGKMAA